jgi:hypothetical protein
MMSLRYTKFKHILHMLVTEPTLSAPFQKSSLYIVTFVTLPELSADNVMNRCNPIVSPLASICIHHTPFRIKLFNIAPTANSGYIYSALI